MTSNADQAQGRWVVTRRRIAVVLPLLLVATLAPVLRPVRGPQVRQWAMDLGAERVLRSPDRFSLLGLSAPRAPEGEVKVRVSQDGKRWSRWEAFEFESEVGPDPGSHESGASTSMPVWTGPNRYVEVKGAPPGSKVHAVDPGPDPSPPANAAYASPAKPGIVTRAGWGADESIRRGKPSYAGSLQLSVIHHTATTDNYASNQSDDIIRSIYAYHVRTNGWDDIGYNFIIDRYGRIFEGRYGGVTRNVIGAHAQGFNTGSTGIAILGNFAGSKPPEVAMQSLKRLVSWRMDQGTVDPSASVTYTSRGSNKYPAGTRVRLSRVVGHRDVGHTECPGNPLQGALGWLRLAARDDGLPKLFDAKFSTRAFTPNGDGVKDTTRLTGRFSSGMNWKIDILDPLGTRIYSVSGSGTSLGFTWNGKNSAGALVSHAPYRFRISGKGAAGSLRTYQVAAAVYRWPDGTYFNTSKGVNLFLYKGRLRQPTSAYTRASWYKASELVKVSDAITSYYPVGPPIGFRTGSLVRADRKIYLISDGWRKPVSASVLRARGYDTRAIIDTTETALRTNPVGESVGTSSPYPSGTTLRSSAGGEAWMRGTIARPFVSSRARASHMIRGVDLAGPADPEVAGGATSQPIGFRDGTLVRASGTSGVYLVSGGKRLPFPNSSTFRRMGYAPSQIREVTAAELQVHPVGPSL